MRRLLIFCLLCAAFAAPALSDPPPNASRSYKRQKPAVGFTVVPPSTNEALLGGILFYHARTDFSGRTSTQRAAQVQQRLNSALSQGPVHPSDITVGQVQGDWAVLFKGRRFLTADPETARINHSNPPALAQKWAQMLQKTLPSLTRPTNTPPKG